MRKWLLTIFIIFLFVCLPYGITFGKTLVINSQITVDVPDNFPNFTQWPGKRVQSQISRNLGVVVVHTISPYDSSYRYVVVVFAHLTNCGQPIDQILAAVIQMKEEKEVAYFIDASYLEGKLADRKLVHTIDRPDFDQAIKNNDHSYRMRRNL